MDMGVLAIGLIPLTLLVLVEIILKGFALWYSAKNQQKVWFVILLFLNTAGILPAIYLIWFRRKK